MARGLSDPATAALVDRQMRNWELARSQRLATPGPQRREVEDFICVSRMAGVGDEVSNLLGERLGWPVFDRELLSAMAGDDARRRQLYASMDEHDVSWWEEVLNPLIREGVTRNDYFHRLCETVLSLARQGSAVFIGRGLDRILPADLGFRVQLIATLEERVARWLERYGGSAESARAEITRVEEDRNAFIRHHYGVRATEPLRYDLTLRVDRLPPQRAVELILRARRCFRPRP